MNEKLNAMRTAIKNDLNSPNDLKALYDVLKVTLLKDELFSLLNETSKKDDYIKMLCSSFKYEIAAKGDVIFTQGDVSTQKFYVIVNGKAGVLVNQDPLREASRVEYNEEQENDPFSPNIVKKMRNKEGGFIEKEYVDMMKRIFHTDIKDDDTFNNKDEFDLKGFQDLTSAKAKRLKPVNMTNNKQFMLLNKLMNQNVYQQLNSRLDMKRLIKVFEKHYSNDDSQLKEYELKSYEDIYGKCVRVLDVGTYFGEKAIEEQKTRSATILALTNIEFLVLNRNDYQLCIQNALKKSKLQISDFFIKALHCGDIYKDTNFYYTLVNGFNVK